MFGKPAGGWIGNIVEQVKLFASDGVTDDDFGYSVAVSGATVVVGAPGFDGDRGAAYVFGGDITPPVITYAVSGTLGDNGWFVDDVTVDWTITDPESAFSIDAGCLDVTLDVDTLPTTLYCTATSEGGQSTDSITVKRDAGKPGIAGSRAPSANAAGWNNTDVTASFTCSDTISGIASCSPDQPVTAEGTGLSATGTAVDNAGNSQDGTINGINIDRSAPVITPSRVPAANAAGWNNAAVTVSYECSDTLSGVESCSTPETLSSEGAAQSATGTATDQADNSASATLGGISIDFGLPTITGSAAPAPNVHGWNNTPVTVSFDCADGLSGIETCTVPETLSSEGAGQSVNGTAVDQAGNGRSGAVAGIDIDRTAPAVTVTGVAQDGLYELGSAPPAGCSTSDALSGVETPAVLSVTGGSSSGLGRFTATCSGAADQAGNNAVTVGVEFMVSLRCAGRLATILGTDGNDTLVGSAGPDVIHGLGGNDTIAGLGGDDLLCGDAGNDVLRGGGGNDTLAGGLGKDKLYGQGGRDKLSGEGGNDRLIGGGGNDLLRGGAGDDVMNGGAGVRDRCNGGPHRRGNRASNCELARRVP